MNAGTLSVILYAIAVTLLATGWLNALTKELKIHRMALAGWLTLVTASGFVNIAVGRQIIINIGWLFVLGVTLFFYTKGGTGDRLTLFSTTAFGGALCYFIHEMSLIDPALFPFPAYWMQAGVLLLISGTVLRGAWPRLTLLMGSFTFAYLLSASRHFTAQAIWSFGHPAFIDLLWIGLFGLIVLESASAGMRRVRRAFIKND